MGGAGRLGEAHQHARSQLSQAAGEKQANLSEKKAFALMLENPSMIRRPIVESGRTLLVGFDPDEYAQKLR